jgi:type VI protein secretion system component VasK
MILLLAFVNQVCPSYKDFFKENLIIIWTAMTALSLFFFMKFGLVLIRIVTCLLILAILMASFAILLGDAAPEMQSAIFIVIEIVTALFFLLWNFWPKGKKQGNDEAI